MRMILGFCVAVLLAALTVACDQESSSLKNEQQSSFFYYIDGTSRASSSVSAFPKSGSGLRLQPQFALYGVEGRLLWRTEADTAVVLPGRADPALVAWTPHAEGDGSWGTTRVAAIGRDGRVTALGQWRHSSAVPLFADERRLVYAVADHRSTRVYVRRGDRVATLRVNVGGPIYSWSSSRDGTRLALIVPGLQSSSYLVVWVEVSAQGRPRLLGRPGLSINSYVSLSGDGSRAVLGGMRPVLVAFGSRSGRRLPMAYVSQAWVGDSRICIMRFWSVNNAERERALVLDGHGRELWRVNVSGLASAVKSDQNARFVAYRRGESEGWHIVDVCTGREETVTPVYADVVPIKTGGFLAVDQTGHVVACDSPFRP